MIKLEELQINEVRDMFFDKCMMLISKNQNSSDLMLNAVEFIHFYLINSENFEPQKVVSISMLLADCFHDSTIEVKESIANLLYFVVTNISNSFFSEFNNPMFFAFIIDIGSLHNNDLLEKSFIMIDTIFHFLSSTGIDVSGLFESYDLDDDFENLMELGIESKSQVIQEIISKFVFNNEE
ncbi:hypothetical protein TVAG_118610 [Trichomonas vaginalis G3]|uniref:Uncharacterized protein n=1 Tax=Trichomonas vaginalis (strain ATCC PRA-98 / G3) TaxID=412133 RepID=A2EAW4_TRIV3|nr:hypothetical protein TVAGG3_0773580 [Trichomonas vaginalis G3]EAY10209.1 hypothetical protein TVAG_118610 [Trichomonas vaginalis G3]KAI5513993.1 hypothetical protein TVAGG3_0773580 [Trichomonas vaginalis G3]|eukprot:XP_001322432.1 hypothetical protein [Trichomonas vaginalis G3]